MLVATLIAVLFELIRSRKATPSCGAGSSCIRRSSGCVRS